MYEPAHLIFPPSIRFYFCDRLLGIAFKEVFFFSLERTFRFSDCRNWSKTQSFNPAGKTILNRIGGKKQVESWADRIPEIQIFLFLCSSLLRGSEMTFTSSHSICSLGIEGCTPHRTPRCIISEEFSTVCWVYFGWVYSSGHLSNPGQADYDFTVLHLRL